MRVERLYPMASYHSFNHSFHSERLFGWPDRGVFYVELFHPHATHPQIEYLMTAEAWRQSQTCDLAEMGWELPHGFSGGNSRKIRSCSCVTLSNSRAGVRTLMKVM